MTDQNEISRYWHTEVGHEQAMDGSACLREAMRREFRGFAIHHRISVKDATILLMNGVGL